MKKYFLCCLLFVPLVFFSCNDESEITPDDETTAENTEDDISDETLVINQWIDENMANYYLWNNYLPEIDYTKESNSEDYFYKLLYEDDKWSWITDDYASLNAEFSGVPVSMGYDPSFYLFGDSVSVFMVVNYVYPDSPADDAGLERGDIILSINNTELDTTNYYDLYSGSKYSVELGSASNSVISYTGESIDMTARVTDANPSIYHDIFEIDGKKIGYLVYVEFVVDDNLTFLSTLDNIFADFNSAGISDLIVDLRYNPGGEIDAAAYLASEIAPASVVSSEEVLVNMQYNDDLQAYLEYYEEDFPDYLSYKFSNEVTNANMNRVYFLTTSGTASASELLISGLEPYMDVVQIGERTYGKYTGAWVMPDDNDEWAMVPIVLKYANVNGYTEFKDGLEPDYEIEDDLLSAVPFGDTSDPMVAQAIELATGSVVATTLKTKSAYLPTFKKLKIPAKKELKRNLIVPLLKKEE